jgi:bacillopeptidase F (M6 metalloprotease family)
MHCVRCWTVYKSLSSTQNDYTTIEAHLSQSVEGIKATLEQESVKTRMVDKTIHVYFSSKIDELELQNNHHQEQGEKESYIQIGMDICGLNN